MLWSRVFGGSGLDDVEALAVDAGSNVYIAGTFASDTLSFGGSTGVTHAMTSSCASARRPRRARARRRCRRARPVSFASRGSPVEAKSVDANVYDGFLVRWKT